MTYYHRFSTTHFRTAALFDLPEIHKPDYPLRPIVSMRGSLFALLGRFLAEDLSPYGKCGQSLIRNPFDLIDMLQSVSSPHEALLTSLDVQTLFTNIPVWQALVVIKDILNNDRSLVER